MENVRILIVDDHQMLRDALRSLLEKTPDFEVVGDTGDPFAVLNLVRETLPDVVCMDVGLPGMSGIEITRQLLAAYPVAKVIALSSYSEPRYVMDMMSAGASAYITKTEAVGELLRAISAVRQNRKYFCPDVATVLTSTMNRQSNTTLSDTLGNRERQVLQLIAKGLTSAMIADRLNIATSTVEVHRRNLMRKLNIHNVAALTRYAISNELTSLLPIKNT